MGGKIYQKSIIPVAPTPNLSWEECVLYATVAPD